ncbi:S8 family serine peptidase [Candidatus Woesearchaeota archaeon]|nr:S8 family serine peptidase [Candidatus Woesearchaeota archaeon]
MKKEMDDEVNWVHVKILVGFLLVSALFGYAFYSDYVNNYEDNSLTGYVVFEGGTKVSTEKLSPELVQEIRSGNNEPKIIIVLEDTIGTTSADLEQRKDAIQEVQQEVIAELESKVEVLTPEEKPEIITTEGTASEEELNIGIAQEALPESEIIQMQEQEADFEVTQEFSTVNAFAGEVKTAEALAELVNSDKVKQILLDYPVEVSLDQSVPRINATLVWNLSVNNNSIDGSGETICIVDTGIDYTHPALGGCAPVTYQLSGTVANLSTPVESAHPYNDSMDYTWKINLSGYTNIAVHFANFSLEAMPSGGDTTDRIYIYDQNNNTLAIYKESDTDVWTPHGIGDTIYVRLVSDSSVTDYGFYIDQVINGTTNTTMNWSSCSKVIGGWDTYNNDADPKDDHGHGTHVAGIAASTNNTYRGVAPGANLIGVKALSAAGGGHSSDVVAGMDWCVQNANKYNISIISMSLGCSGSSCVHYQSYCTGDLTASAVAAAYTKNISVFIASGNSGWTDGISNPACVQYAIPIGAADGNEAIIYNRGSLLKLLVPGTGIDSTTLNGGWISLSGTSMATPHAAGAAALFREYWKAVYGTNPTPAQILSKFSATGKVISDTGSGLNFSRIDVFAAVKPIINFTSSMSANGSVISVNSLWINVTSDVPLSSARLDWTNANATTFNYTLTNYSSTNFYYNLTGLNSGTYTYRVYGNDSLTEAYTETRAVTINYTTTSIPTPIQLTIASPANNTYHRASFALNISLNSTNSSLANISSLTYNFTNSSGLNVLSNSSGSLNVANYSLSHQIIVAGNPFGISALPPEQNNSLGDGNYTLSIVASDTLGGNSSTQYKIMIDTIVPSILNINCTSATLYTNESITFRANVSDLNLNSSGVIFSLNYSGNWSNYSMSQQNDSLFNYTLMANTFSANTTLYYQAYAYDLAGNVNSSGILNVSVIFVNATNTTSDLTSLINNITSPRTNETVIEVGNTTLFNATTNITGNLTYLWGFGDGTNATSLSINKQYNVTGNYNVTLNISNNSTSVILNLSVVVNDTQAPTITSVSYSSTVHLGKDKTQLVNATLFDYSNLSSVKLYYKSAGSNSFTLEAMDNFTTTHAKNYTYNFTVISCSDGTKNGDESEVDCGGSCSACVVNTTTTTPAPTPAKPAETPKSAANTVSTAAVPAAPVEAVQKNITPVNWTTDLKASEVSKREKALYILGGILIFLLAIYALIVMRR